MSMLEYYKMILQKISIIDKELYKKEFEKAFRDLNLEDQSRLMDWWLTSEASEPLDVRARKRA